MEKKDKYEMSNNARYCHICPSTSPTSHPHFKVHLLLDKYQVKNMWRET